MALASGSTVISEFMASDDISDSAKQDRLQLSFIPDDRTSRLTNTAESGSGLRRAEAMKSHSSVDKGRSGPF